jgi:MFS family permease
VADGRDSQCRTVAATLCAFAQYAALVNLVPLLEGRGLSASLAAWGLGLGGAGQVAGRLCCRFLMSSGLGIRGRAAAVIAAGGASTLLLGLLPGPAALLLAVAVIAGLSSGPGQRTRNVRKHPQAGGRAAPHGG